MSQSFDKNTYNEEKAFEQKRVNRVVKTIKQKLNYIISQLQKAHQETKKVEKNYSQNTKINTEEVDDQMETNAEVQQQKQLVAKNVENEQILTHQKKLLTELSTTPYFGRIDILDAGQKTPEALYIGTGSVTDENGEFLIYDWRTPISSVYYNGTLGQVSFQTPAGKQTTKLVKKRQFTIENGTITNMFDTNETVGDKMLQAVLGQHADDHMKNIVATIQSEQNDIIRNTTSDLLIVNGVAGSGKTSTILQRIAFLLYHSRTSLDANQIVLFSPNTLFSNYISSVLPSLGEKNMRQVTLAHFLSQRLHGLKISSLFDDYEAQFNHQAQNQLTAVKQSARIISQLKNYLSNLAVDDLCFIPIRWQNNAFFDAPTIRHIYAQLPTNLTHAGRYRRVQNTLIKRLNRRIKTDANADWVQTALNNLSEEKIKELSQSVPNFTLLDYQSQQQKLGQKITAKHYASVYDAIYNDYFIDFYQQYAKFLATAINQQAATDFLKRIELHQIIQDDSILLLYLRDFLTGGGQNRQIAHLFVDEMQDYSPASLCYLRHAFPKAKFTLLGDRMQALYAAASKKTWLKTLASELDAQNCHVVNLTKAYRSSYEISDFLRYLLPEKDALIPFNRHENRPVVYLTKTYDEQIARLKSIVKAAQAKQSIAIITKTLPEAKRLAHFFNDDEISLVTPKTTNLATKPLIIPIYLAKGLEFDHVILINVDATHFNTSHDSEILYTMCSRALHQLSITATGKISPLITAIPFDKYELHAQLSLS